MAAEAPLNLDLSLDTWLMSDTWSDLTWPIAPFSGVPSNFCFIKFSQKRTIGAVQTPWPHFYGPLTPGWGNGNETLAVQSAGGKVSLCKISALWVKWCSHLYRTYKHARRQSPLLYWWVCSQILVTQKDFLPKEHLGIFYAEQINIPNILRPPDKSFLTHSLS